MKLSAAYLRGGMHQVEMSDDGLIGALSSQGKRAADEPGLSPNRVTGRRRELDLPGGDPQGELTNAQAAGETRAFNGLFAAAGWQS
ncbi:MAG: hypothetical protein FJ392_06955 [Verrucomicrobia bacterium]|nr:hypothetical protein [Verrucomicrobiota bacterium]